MNERYAVDPGALDSGVALKYLLERFGIFTGRYVAQYPSDWDRHVLRRFESMTPLESERVKVALRRARERMALIGIPKATWRSNLSWWENAKRSIPPGSSGISGLICDEEDLEGKNAVIPIDGIDWGPTAEERILATVGEIKRVCEIVVKTGFEVFLVDPFMDPRKRPVGAVLRGLLSLAGQTGSRTRRVVLFVRRKVIVETGRVGSCEHEQVTLARKCINEMLRELGLQHRLVVDIGLVDDSVSAERMHDRYLFSVKGGVEVSQGFQTLRGRGMVTVRPISPTVHEAIWRTYIDKRTDMKFEEIG